MARRTEGSAGGSETAEGSRRAAAAKGRSSATGRRSRNPFVVGPGGTLNKRGAQRREQSIAESASAAFLARQAEAGGPDGAAAGRPQKIADQPDQPDLPTGQVPVIGDAAGPGMHASDPFGGHNVRRDVSTKTSSPIPITRRGLLRYRVLPRSVIGISMLILSFAIGAGFSGVVLYSYYQYKQNQANDKVNALVSNYKKEFTKAQDDLHAAVVQARNDIQEQLKAVRALEAGPQQLDALIKQMAPSVFFVHTLDAAGQPSVGTAFVISSNPSQSLLLASYTTVAAATRSPGPQVFVHQGSGSDTAVTVRVWDAQNDLALLVLGRGGLPALTPAPASPSPQPGDRIFAVSGLGTAGAAVAQGSVVDVASWGLAVDSAVGTAFQGGPVVNQQGQVLAIGSRAFAPLSFTSDGIWDVPNVNLACQKVLSCPNGALPGSH